MKKNRKKSALALAVAFALTTGCFPTAPLPLSPRMILQQLSLKNLKIQTETSNPMYAGGFPRPLLTDEQLKTEIQQMYDSGFDGVELCMQTSEAPTEDYAYGSDMWAHKWKLMMNTLLDHWV